MDGVLKTLEAIIGVKQGDLLGPQLFTFFIAAVMETWRSSSTHEFPTFRSRPDYQMTGRRSTARGDEFSVSDLEYADDTGLPFCSRSDLDEQTPRVVAHFKRSQRRIGSRKLSGQGTERYYFSGIARVTKKKPESHLVWYSDANSGSRDGTFDARARQ